MAQLRRLPLAAVAVGVAPRGTTVANLQGTAVTNQRRPMSLRTVIR
jgi:hypothetical protein